MGFRPFVHRTANALAWTAGCATSTAPCGRGGGRAAGCAGGVPAPLPGSGPAPGSGFAVLESAAGGVAGPVRQVPAEPQRRPALVEVLPPERVGSGAPLLARRAR
ncbi:hypothetical protein [Streptomyces sp. NPDC004050]